MRQQNAPFAGRPRENVRIGDAWRGYPDPKDIVPRSFKRDNSGPGKIFIREEAHVTLRWGILSQNLAYLAHKRGTQ